MGERDAIVMRYILSVAGDEPFETLRKRIIEGSAAIRHETITFA